MDALDTSFAGLLAARKAAFALGPAFPADPADWALINTLHAQ